MPISRPDCVFTVDANKKWVPTGGTRSTQVRMASSFESLPRSVKDMASFSFIANILSNQNATGTLSICVANTPATTSSDGTVSFVQPVDWLLKQTSSIAVGGTDAEGNAIEPLFDLSLPFGNAYSWAKLVYTATSGDGIFYARFGGVEV